MTEKKRDVGIPLIEYGRGGLKQDYGRVNEEWLSQLKGTSGVKAFREMADNDATVGAMLFIVEMLCRSVDPYFERPEGLEGEQAEKADWYAEKFEEMRGDMEHTWSETLADILSMMVFGYSVQEIVLKLRKGFNPDVPQLHSKYNDGLFGIRKLADRPQETIDRWDFDSFGNLCGLYQIAPPDYRERYIPIKKVSNFRFRGKSTNPEGRSALRHLYRTWFFKKNNEEQEMVGFERGAKGLPLLEVPLEVITINPGDRENSVKSSMQDLVENLYDDSLKGALIPAEMDHNNNPTGFKLRFQGQGQTQPIDFDKTINRQDKTILRGLIAEFLALGMDSTGSFALSSDKTKMFALVVDAILSSIDRTIERTLIPVVMEANGWDLTLAPQHLHSDIETPDLAIIGNYLNQLIATGLLTPDDNMEDYVRSIASFPPRDESPAMADMTALLTGDTNGQENTEENQTGQPLPGT